MLGWYTIYNYNIICDQYLLGFPYTNEDLIQKDLTQLLSPLVEDDTCSDQVILMTHIGPSISCKYLFESMTYQLFIATTEARDDPKSFIISGSNSLTKWLANEKIVSFL